MNNRIIREYIKKANNKAVNSINNRIYNSKRNAVYTFWYTEPKNFGDLLNPILLKHFGLVPLNTTKKNAEIITAGSLLQNLPEDFSGFIVGSGLIHDEMRNFPNAKVLAVRGALTRDRIGAPMDIPLGDPGLLVPMFYERSLKKNYVLGLVPHYADKQDLRLLNISKRYPQDVKIIDVQQRPKQVVSDIDQCAFILSSSLHGLVMADSMGIPNGWILLSNNVRGKGFKFFDYASAFKRHIVPIVITGEESLSELLDSTTNVNNGVLDIQNILEMVFHNLVREILKNS